MLHSHCDCDHWHWDKWNLVPCDAALRFKRKTPSRRKTELSFTPLVTAVNFVPFCCGGSSEAAPFHHTSPHADSWPNCVCTTEQPGTGFPSSKGWKEVTQCPFPLPCSGPDCLGPQPKSRIRTGIVIAVFLLLQKALGLKALWKGWEQDHTETIPDKKERFIPAMWNVMRSCLPWIKEFSS